MELVASAAVVVMAALAAEGTEVVVAEVSEADQVADWVAVSEVDQGVLEASEAAMAEVPVEDLGVAPDSEEVVDSEEVEDTEEVPAADSEGDLVALEATVAVMEVVED